MTTTVADLATLKRRIGATSKLSPDDETTLEECLAAAHSVAAELCYDASLGSEPVANAVLLLAQRWYRRRQTPEGVAGFGGDGVVVRILSRDPDVAALLERHYDTSRAGLG